MHGEKLKILKRLFTYNNNNNNNNKLNSNLKIIKWIILSTMNTSDITGGCSNLLCIIKHCIIQLMH